MNTMLQFFFQWWKREEPKDEVGFHGLYVFLLCWLAICIVLPVFLLFG